MDTVYKKTHISADMAQALVLAAHKEAQQRDLQLCIAVVDSDGQLLSFQRMDAAPVVAIEACQAKARAALMGLPSAELGAAVADQPAMLAGMSQLPGLCILGGGLPLLSGGKIIGAIGVGGGSTDEDVAVAHAAIAAVLPA